MFLALGGRTQTLLQRGKMNTHHLTVQVKASHPLSPIISQLLSVSPSQTK